MSAPDRIAVATIPAIDAFRRDRLPHVLPDFTRVSWVSDRARAVWEPRVSRIGSASC